MVCLEQDQEEVSRRNWATNRCPRRDRQPPASLLWPADHRHLPLLLRSVLELWEEKGQTSLTDKANVHHFISENSIFIPTPHLPGMFVVQMLEAYSAWGSCRRLSTLCPKPWQTTPILKLASTYFISWFREDWRNLIRWLALGGITFQMLNVSGLPGRFRIFQKKRIIAVGKLSVLSKKNGA